MGISKRNSEGYLDLTAWQAISNIEREAALRRHRARKKKPLPKADSPMGQRKNTQIGRIICVSERTEGKKAVGLLAVGAG